ncbi:MAG: hypothetical protein PVSMB6_21700 [Steroidobacteraceae bacterium]
MEDLTLKLGLLMEAAQAQQALAANALEALRERTGALDNVVREEIRTTLIEELREVADDSRRAAHGLRALQRVATVRIAVWSLGIATLATALPLGLAWWLLPTRADVVALRLLRDQLNSNIQFLSAQGGRAALRRCGAAHRLCVRVDRDAPAYGDAGDYLVVKGY